MKIALIGYGKMGKEIERIAKDRGHEISCIIDVNNKSDFDSEAFKNSDVAIEFSAPVAAFDNYMKCFEANVPVVSGTTGWLDKIDIIKEACAKGQTFFYASNYSIGVNIFFHLNKVLAKIMNNFPDYDISMEEVHHTQKLDAPSGTAITLAEDIIGLVDAKDKWVKEVTENDNEIAIGSVRHGETPGIHTVKYDSDIDKIVIHHSAHSRRGFAMGAVIAAEFTCGKKGFLGMEDMMSF